MKYLILLLLMVGCSHSSINSSADKVSAKQVDRLQMYSPVDLHVKVGEVGSVILPYRLAEQDRILCENLEVPFDRYEGKTFLIVRVSYFANKKPFSCKVVTSDGEEKKIINVIVENKKFHFERLFVDKKRVVLSPADQKRAHREQMMLNKLYANYHRTAYFNTPFILPIHSKVTSIYGTKRIYNHNKKGQHLGTDYRAAIGEKIIVSNRGRVAYAGDLFFTGNTVIVDHGLGIFTVYGHLSKILVNTGDMVERGDLIGLSGATGRVSGPHLHWGVKVLGQYIEGDSLIRATAFLKQ